MFKSHDAWLPLLVGILGAFVFVRALVTGRIRGRGTLPPFLRGTEPVSYWVTVCMVGLVAAALVGAAML